MSYRLVIAEKPSVGAAYAKVLGATNRQDGYWEGNGYLVSWCIGHLVELAPPNVYDEKFVKWRVADLPILPERWQYLVSASTKKQFGILKKLMNRPDVDSVTAATDAGREGELIFRLVYQQTGCKKPVFRLWLSSMEESAIREGFANLKPSTEYDALYNAALCRERADWIVGINASRLFSCLYGRPLAVGRVMTPVLAMTVVREAEIAAFIPEKFYTVALAFAGGGTASSKRFSQKADAEALLTSCRKEACAVVQDAERKEKSENPPQLYDLTTLQRDANRLLGFTAQQTLNYAQSLYEKRLITYPRTDSRFLTEDMAEALPGLASGTAAIFGAEEKLLVHVQQVINGSKVTDHHALLPTEKGRALVTVMPEQIQSPEMTADWENKLLRIERGEMEPEEFMTEIKEMVALLVNTTEAVKGANALMKNKVIGACPNCGTNVVEREKGWFCENRECRFALWKDNAYFKRLGKHLDGRVVDKLLRDGRVRLKDCKSAKGKTYNATVLLSAESDGRSKFSLEFENGGC